MTCTKYFINLVLISAFSLSGLSGCGKDTDKNKQAPLGLSGGSSSNGREVDNSSAAPTCDNPISLDSQGLKPLLNVKDFPQGKLKLTLMQLYMLNPSTGDSFLISNQASNDFAVNLECNGVKDPAAQDTAKSWTDSDGKTHYQSSKHTSNLSGDFSSSEWIDTVSKQKSSQQRQIKAKFENGKLLSSESTLITDPSGTSSLGFENLTLNKIDLGGGNLLTLRFYSPASSQLEMRILMEFKDSKSGHRMIEYAKEIYELTN